VQDFKGNDPRFSAYFLKSILNGTSSDKAAVPGVNRNDLHARKVIVTRDRMRQESIVAVLSAYDDLIENNRRRIQLLEQAARLLYKEWFVHLRFPGHEHVKIVDGVPEGWDKKKISDVCETVGGGTPSTKVSEYWNGEITWVVPTDVTRNNCLVLLDSERKITAKGLRESSAKMVPAETILMTSRASVGYFALMDKEVCTNQGFINIFPYDTNSRMYLLFNLLSRVSEIRGNAKGTTYPEISKGRFREMGIILPSTVLVAQFEFVVFKMMKQVRYLMRATQQLKAARDLILPKLMNGEVAV
jgi:type I restriction enzyme S subunit